MAAKSIYYLSIFDPMRFLQICLVLMTVNFLVPSVVVHFVDKNSDDALCELLEDFGEEEEDDESHKDIEDSLLFKEWYANHALHLTETSISKRFYSDNNTSIRNIDLEVQTPPPQNTLS